MLDMIQRASSTRFPWQLAALSLAFVATVSAADRAAVGAAATIVEIDKFAFVPKELTVAPGTRVRWTNHDETPHTVTSQAIPKAFASKAMDTDDQYEFTFAKEGDFTYFCTVHPMMTGIVHVTKSGAKGK